MTDTINLRNAACNLEIASIVDNDDTREVRYVVPDNTAGITAVMLCTWYEVDPPSDPLNPTCVLVQSNGTQVDEAISAMTGWELEYAGDYENGWDYYVPVARTCAA